jgi:hypothetical protein
MTAECTSIAIYCRDPSPTNITPLVMSPRSPASDIREADSRCRSCSIEVERTGGHCLKFPKIVSLCILGLGMCM